MMVCMAGLQVFIVRFFFQVSCPRGKVKIVGVNTANYSASGCEKGIRVNDWALTRDCILVGYWENGMGESENSVYLYITTLWARE